MPPKDDPLRPPLAGHGTFHTTHWSVVLAAREASDPQGSMALESLCRTYWYPLYAFERRRGYNPEEAQDLTQGFFARLLEKHYLAAVHPRKGRFRSFLLTAVKCFLSDERDRARAQKRGGNQAPISLDTRDAEVRYHAELAHDGMPDRLFDRRWAMTLLAWAQERLRDEYFAAGKGDLFEQLKSFYDQDETTIGYADAAAQLALPVNTIKSHVLRLRRRYRQLLREEIARTVSEEAEVEEEIRYLLEVVTAS